MRPSLFRSTISAALLTMTSVAFFPSARASADVDSEVAGRFKRDAHAAWSELRRRAFDMRALVTLETEEGVPDLLRSLQTLEFNGNSGNLLVENKGIEGSITGLHEVRAINSEYSFFARRNSDESSLVVRSVSDFNLQEVIARPTVERAMFLPIMIQWTLLDELVSAPTFTVTGASRVAADVDGLVEVQFTSDDLFNAFNYRDGRMVLDTARYWALREFDAQVLGPGEEDNVTFYKIRNEYDGDIDGFPVPRRHFFEASSPTTGVFSRVTLTVNEFGTGNIRQDQCTLPAFGLPDPVLASKAVDRNWLFFLNVIGIGGICLAFLLRHIIHKRSSASSGNYK